MGGWLYGHYDADLDANYFYVWRAVEGAGIEPGAPYTPGSNNLYVYLFGYY